MTESQIKKRAVEIFEERGWFWWFPVKSKWGKEKDIFGVFDCIVVIGGFPSFIQLTTLSNVSARRRKIENFVFETHFKSPRAIWAWDKKKGAFKIINLIDSQKNG